ncbi:MULTISPECIES: CoA transferase [unclassified Ensifer]|uniref:CaiB/BaiF CoA transferase family protein n=1 Tax=unclassified Ensifer TaxID=2633371 RepID=UPI0008130F45|nr:MULTISPECIES: CoA transferase [unclassified Ensifer]OCP15877.1 acyl-CoA transferase [Ensifer sp. LC384]OCP19947.1 acyl-CoA transferase [Ensifer sp. LC54]OCP35372.1 acyl-CoA transferase [Ensifer sp. LC163]
MTSKPKSFDTDAKGPLDGIRVVDLSRLVAGNMLSLQLGDFGADVIKVEPPVGDPLRDWRDGGSSLYWKTYGRNKRSVMLNLREPAAMDAMLKLLDTADVFIENFRPGTLEEMGMAPETLLARNPDLIIVRISGFGQTGPYATLPGFGTLVEAMSGFAARTGFADREPVLPPLALADMIAGIYGSSAVSMALLARQRGIARGQVIDLSLLEPMFSVLGPEAAIYKTTGKIKERVGSGSNTTSPRNVYRCADGKYVALSGSTQAVAKRIFEIIGRPEMIADPRFATNTDRVRNRPLVDEAVGAWFATRGRDDALDVMRRAGATVGPVYNIADAFSDAHFIEREVFTEVEDREHGSLPMHNILPRMSATPGVWRNPAPALGENTRDVLNEVGLSADEIDLIMGGRTE